MKTGTASKNGAALLGLIGALLVLSLIVAGVLVLLSTGMMGSLEKREWTQAFNAAETGVSAARGWIVTNDFWYTNMPVTITGSVGRVGFSAQINTTNPPNAVITSVGTKGNAQCTSIWAGTVGVSRAFVVYRQDGEFRPCYRRYSDTNLVLFSEQNARSVGNNFQWQRIVADPLTNEFLLVTQNSNRQVWAQAYTNSGWLTPVQLNASGLVTTNICRGFDVAYEDLSGRAMAVYSIGTNTLRYKIWDGTNWSGENPIAVGAPAIGAIRWVRLAPKPRSNEIMLLSRWVSNNNWSAAIRWTGTAWGDLQALETNCASEIAYESMDASWSTNSAMAVYINGGTLAARRIPKYRQFTGAWTAEASMTGLANPPRWIRVEFYPKSTNAYAAILDSASKISGSHWSGSAWGNTNNFTNATLQTSAYRAFDIAWDSQTNRIMVTYCQQTVATHSYMIQVVGAAAGYGNMAAGTANGRWSVLRPDPRCSEFLYAAIDANSDVTVQRWNGASWISFGRVELTSALNYNSIDMAFRLDL